MLNVIAEIKKGLSAVMGLLSDVVKLESEYKKFIEDKREFDNISNTKVALLDDVANLELKKKDIVSFTEQEVAALKDRHDEYINNTNAILKKEEDRILALQVKDDETLKASEILKAETLKIVADNKEIFVKNEAMINELSAKNEELNKKIKENEKLLSDWSVERIKAEGLRLDVASREKKLAQEKAEFEKFRDEEYKANTAALIEAKATRDNTSAMLNDITKKNNESIKLLSAIEVKTEELKKLEAKIAKDKKDLDDKEKALAK